MRSAVHGTDQGLLWSGWQSWVAAMHRQHRRDPASKTKVGEERAQADMVSRAQCGHLRHATRGWSAAVDKRIETERVMRRIVGLLHSERRRSLQLALWRWATMADTKPREGSSTERAGGKDMDARGAGTVAEGDAAAGGALSHAH